MRLPRLAIYLIAVFLVTESWCLAMIREVERDLGVLDPILRVFLGGFQLPVLTTLSRLSGPYGEFFPEWYFSVSPVCPNGICPVRRLVTAICRRTVVVCSVHAENEKARSRIMSNKARVSIVTPVFNEVEGD